MSDKTPQPVQPVVYGADWFRNRRAERAAKRAKRHRLLFEIFGIDNVQSHFLAFDPFDAFYLSEKDISPANRERKVLVRTNYNPRARIRRTTLEAGSTPLYVVGVGQNGHLPYSSTRTVSETTSSMPSQAKIFGFIKDTSKRTRPIGVEYGEAEMFLPSIHSPSRSVRWKSGDVLSAGTDLWGPYQNRNITTRLSYNQGLGATLSQATLDTHRLNEQNRASVLMPKHAEELYASSLPGARRFDLIREIGELKDLPSTIKSTFDALLGSLSGSLRKDISSVYLNKEFGWDPLFKSIEDLIHKPTKIVKRINYLMGREGKPTTLSASKKFLEPLESTAGFTYTPLIDLTDQGTFSLGFRKITLRSAINCLVKFPPLEGVSVKQDLTDRVWGMRFQPQDLYNLIPWTWLTDWFTGLGDYIERFCVINEDPSIINYGFLTYVSKGELRTANISRASSTSSVKACSSCPTVTDTTYLYDTHCSVLRYKYYLRRDYTNLREMKLSWDPGTLSDFQASILTALFFQRR